MPRNPIKYLIKCGRRLPFRERCAIRVWLEIKTREHTSSMCGWHIIYRFIQPLLVDDDDDDSVMKNLFNCQSSFDYNWEWVQSKPCAELHTAATCCCSCTESEIIVGGLAGPVLYTYVCIFCRTDAPEHRYLHMRWYEGWMAHFFRVHSVFARTTLAYFAGALVDFG